MYGYLGNDQDALYRWLDQNLRRVWCKHPARLGLVEKMRFKKLGKSKRGTTMMLWHVDCFHCKKAVREYEVNHKSTVLTIKDFGQYCTNLFLVGEGDLELLCKPCHGIITYMERSGMNFEDAKLEKKVIKFSKLTAVNQKKKLVQAGIILKGRTNEVQRKDAVRDYLRSKRK
jgi:hypothetical protein